ncbi:hypothetical protein HKX48_002439 [Thoreauomyces humboldtii]|nr:hypothetical protein HKX48_002439 [Thoreauomyces humboldtii]
MYPTLKCGNKPSAANPRNWFLLLNKPKKQRNMSLDVEQVQLLDEDPHPFEPPLASVHDLRDEVQQHPAVHDPLSLDHGDPLPALNLNAHQSQEQQQQQDAQGELGSQQDDQRDPHSQRSQDEGPVIENAACVRLVDALSHYIPGEAVELLFEAGFETIEMIKTLNVELSSDNNDLVSVEAYTKRKLKPGHKKLIVQYVTSSRSEPDPENIFDGFETPAAKRRRIALRLPPPPYAPGLPTSPLLICLERHLVESPITCELRKDVDYKVSISKSDKGIPEGVWRCLLCMSRPITISLRNGGRQPQLSNVSTHLKTVKHRRASEYKKQQQQILNFNRIPPADPVTVAVTAALGKHFFEQQQHQEQEEQEEQHYSRRRKRRRASQHMDVVQQLQSPETSPGHRAVDLDRVFAHFSAPQSTEGIDLDASAVVEDLPELDAEGMELHNR